MRPNETLYVSINNFKNKKDMTVDGNVIATSYKVDEFGLTVTFYDEKEQPVFFARLEEPIARIRRILPVRLNYVFDGEITHVTGFLPLKEG